MEDTLLVQIIVAAIAFLGLCLSICNLILRYIDQKPQIKVTNTTLIIGQPGIGIISPLHITITAKNIGIIPVHLSSCGIILPNKKILQFIGPDKYTLKSLPTTLLPGQSIDISREFISLAKDLREEGYSRTIKIKAYFRDQIDNIFKSKSFKFEIERWK